MPSLCRQQQRMLFCLEDCLAFSFFAIYFLQTFDVHAIRYLVCLKYQSYRSLNRHAEI